MSWADRARAAGRAVALVVAACLVAAGCDGQATTTEKTSPAPTPHAGDKKCGSFTIAYSPANGYEASAFIVGNLAKHQLGCHVKYVKTSSRHAWKVVASGDADVYLDAYGAPDLQKRLVRKRGAVTVVGPNGVHGGVDLLAPYSMSELGLENSRDLTHPDQIGWGLSTPVITTAPGLKALAVSLVSGLRLDYGVRDDSSAGTTMSALLPRARTDNEMGVPNVYLVEGPTSFIGDGSGRVSVDMPITAAGSCKLTAVSTLCSVEDFDYLKIANTDFVHSGSPAYRLVYRYRLTPPEVHNILKIVELSGYDVGPADVASWINTHEKEWERWLQP
ncbi:MAG: glycine betaine ABC transporter substrate-binding protein [Nocardioidaceae bacterium]